MIEDTDNVLPELGLPTVDPLEQLLETHYGAGGGGWQVVGQQRLKQRGRRVVRLWLMRQGGIHSVILKRLHAEIARRTERLAHRWLPAVGLGHATARVMGTLAQDQGGCVWQVYEDLGAWELAVDPPDRERVEAAVALLARIHTRFAAHALLGEVRLHGGALGVSYCEANLRDAIYALQGLPATLLERHPAGSQCRQRLLDRLRALETSLPGRAKVLARSGGAETLLHGDLWAVNVFVLPAGLPLRGARAEPEPGAGRWRARLIDWDHVAVGPATYDLSTFLLRFAPAHRWWVLDLYREAVAEAGWALPDGETLNAMFELHEHARFANRVIWPAIALAQDRTPWGWEALSEVEQWFEQCAPVLPAGTEAAA